MRIVFFFNELSHEPELRKKILEMFKKSYYNEEQFKIVSNYLQENKCLEGILSKIKQQYQFQNKSKQKTNFISEIKSIFLIKNEFNILDNEFIYDVVQFISHLIENSNDIKNNNTNFYDEFIQQFIYDTIKNNSKNKNLKYDLINFLIELLLNISDNSLQKKTFHILFEIINNISNYKEIQLNTHLLDNLNEICNCDREIVSYFFLFLMSIEGYYASIELKKIIESLNKYSNIESLKTLFENIIKYHEKNSISFIEFAKDFIPKLYEMIDSYVNKRKNVVKKEILECIIDFCGVIINKNSKIFIIFEDDRFKNLKFEQFFQPLINSNDNYSIGYKLIKIFLDNLNNERKIRDISIKNLVNLILNKYAIITSQFEVENLPITLNEIKYIYETLKSLFSKNKLKEPLNDNFKKCIYNLCDYLSKCKDDFNEEIHKTLKFYFEYIMSIIIIHNDNILKKINSDYPEIYLSEIKRIIYQIITLESELNNKNYLIDMIKFIIDYSLLIKHNINENEKLLNSDFKVIYCNKYIITSEFLKQSYNSQSNYTNFSLLTPLPILFTFKILSKLNKYLIEMLDFIIFLLEVNEGNIKMFLKTDIIKCFFKILNDNFDSNKKINDLILKGLSLLTKFLNKSLFQDLIEEILLFLNNKTNPDYMNIITEIIKILSKNIKLTSDFNIGIILTDYNVKQLNIFNNILINDIKYSNDIQTISIYQHYFFFSSIKSIDYYYLFKIENNKNFIEIYLKNLKLIVNDTKDEKNKIEISIYEILHFNENNSFIFNFNLLESKLSISINNNVILNYEYKYNFYDSKPHTIFIGYKYDYVKELMNDKCYSFPYIKLNSMKILLNQSTISYSLNTQKIFIDNKSYECNNHKKTNLYSDNHTLLFQKYNFYEYAKNCLLLNRNNLKAQLYKYVFYTDTYISKELGNINLEKFIFILLNENDISKDLFYSVIQLFIDYIDILDISVYCRNFFKKKEYINLFYFSLYKNKQYIDKNIIDELYKIATINDINNRIIISIFLNKNIFESLSNEYKIEILNLVKGKIQNDNYLLNMEIFEKLMFLLLVVDNDNELDDEILEICLKLFEMNKNNNKIIKMIKKFIYISYDFQSYINQHIQLLHQDKNQIKIIEIIENIFKKLYSKKLMNYNNKIIKSINNNQKFSIEFKREINQFLKSNSTSISTSIIKSSNKTNIDLNNNISLNEYYIPERRYSFTGEKINFNENNNNEIPKPRPSSKFKRKDRRKTITLTHPSNDSIENNSNNNTNNNSNYNTNNNTNNTNNNTNNNNQNNYYNIKGTIPGIIQDFNTETNRIPIIITLNELINETCIGNCNLCIFIKEYMKFIFNEHKGFNDYKRNLIKIYCDFHLLNYKLNFNFSFSYYLMKSEGPSRVRKKFCLRLDKILNDEIDRSEFIKRKNSNILQKKNNSNNQIINIKINNNDDNNNVNENNNNKNNNIDENNSNENNNNKNNNNDNNNGNDNKNNNNGDNNNNKNENNNENEEKNHRINEYKKKFSFFNINEHLFKFFSLEQIFQINFVKYIVNSRDKYKDSFNCLLSKGMSYINSVIVIGEENIYLISNVNEYKKDLYYVNNPIKKIFWVLGEKFEKTLKEQCIFLSYEKKDNSEEEINKNEMFDRLKKGFEIFSFSYYEINEIHNKKFLHQDNSIEIFLKNGLNFYLVFNPIDRDLVVKELIKQIQISYETRKKNLYLIINQTLPKEKEKSESNIFTPELISTPTKKLEISNYSNSSLKNPTMIFLRDSHLLNKKNKFDIHFHNNVENKKEKNKKFKDKKTTITDVKEILEKVQEKWSNGYISTYDYIMLLNTLSGRTYNDLNQYPIFPWVLSDYKSDEIKLIKTDIYRDFSYPIYAQNEEIREKLKIKYQEFEETDEKYHSGSHYSNPGFVCYYLIRIKPFSLISAEIQSGIFDVPDRLFFDIKSFYCINEKYQELIPDIFNLPELYVNINHFIFGNSSGNLKVNNVILPKWSLNSPRLFSKMMKKSLENAFVSTHINDWIDLIFGYKQKGNEAIESYNVLREVCSNFKPEEIEDNELIEDKINEILNMGINPIQLFNKSHPKREKHQKIIALFARGVFLLNLVEGKEYKIDNFKNKKIKEMYKYYEYIDENISKGEGGFSSFKMLFNEEENNKGKEKENTVYFFCSDNKILLPPTYKNYIEFSSENGIINPSNTFSIIKPYHSIKFTYTIEHNNSVITCMKCTNDGKYLIIGFLNGVIEKYKIKKIKYEIINRIVDNPKQKKKSSIFSKIIPKKKKSKDIVKDKDEIPVIVNSNISKISNDVLFLNNTEIDNNYPISNSNILNNDCIYLNNQNQFFIKYKPKISLNPFKNISEINGFGFHCTNSNEQKILSKFGDNNKNKKNIYILLINSSNIISNSIKLIDLCECFSMLIVIDSFNMIYLFDLISFKLLHKINYHSITHFTKKIKFSSICQFTGDFIVASSREVVLFNINGVILARLKLEEDKTNINSCFIKNIQTTKSDINLFTGHQNGNLIIWKLVTLECDNREKVIYPYYLCYKNENIYNSFHLTLHFNELIRIDLIKYPIKYIKLNENMTKIICIAGDNFITISYEDYQNNKNKKKDKEKDKEKEKIKKKNEKKCNVCHESIAYSKTVCQMCGKKLCSKCKLEVIIPEYSFKTKRPICEDCNSLNDIDSESNKMLYDF